MMVNLYSKKLYKRGIYLYTFNSGYPMRVYKGNVYSTTYCVSPDYIFQESGKDKPHRQKCLGEEGKYYRNCIWLRKRDDEKALSIFYDYIKELIEKKTKQINGYRNRYQFIAKQPIEDFTEGN